MGEMFKMMAGVDLVHVPYRASYFPDLLGGQVQVVFSPLTSVYLVIAVVTFVFQISHRNTICSGIGGCGVSYVKGIVWSAIWPAYWSIQWNWLWRRGGKIPLALMRSERVAADAYLLAAFS
jgi:hypothetical protein